MKTITYLLSILAISIIAGCNSNANIVQNSHGILDEIIGDFLKEFPHFEIGDTLLIRFPNKANLQKANRCDYYYFGNSNNYSNELIRHLYLNKVPSKKRELRKNYNLTINRVCFLNDNYEISFTFGPLHEWYHYIYTYDIAAKKFISKEFQTIIVD